MIKENIAMEEKDSPLMRRRQAVAGESYDPTLDEVDTVTSYYAKNEEQLICLREATRGILFFNDCDKEQQKVLLNAMFQKCVKKDEVIIRQGEDGDNFYIIEKGEYEIQKEDGSRVKRVTLKGKGYFGELALLYNCPRNATIEAKTCGVLWGLDQKTFREIVVKANARKRKVFEELLRSVTILDSLTSYELMNLTDALTEMQFSENECIVKEGDKANKMYFIMSGEVSIKVNDKNNNGEHEVVRLKRGQYFGELALVLNKPRVASVYVLTDGMTCAVLDIYAFERLLGPCIDIMKRNIDVFEVERKRLGIKSIVSQISVDDNLLAFDHITSNADDLSQ